MGRSNSPYVIAMASSPVGEMWVSASMIIPMSPYGSTR
jgi:hypothetical protein